MPVKKAKVVKVNQGYRLPKRLVKLIGHRALKEELRPCEIAERWLLAGYQSERSSAAKSKSVDAIDNN